MITNKQLGMIHAAKTRLALEDMEYRGMLVQVAGVTSSKDLNQKGFERVMAWFEQHGGWQGQKWQAAAASLYCSSRQIDEMRLLAAGRDELLASLATRMSRGTAPNSTKLRPWQASKVIEALKSIVRREIEEEADHQQKSIGDLIHVWGLGDARSLRDLDSRCLMRLWSMLKGKELPESEPRPQKPESVSPAGAVPAGACSGAAAGFTPCSPPLPVMSFAEAAAAAAEDFDEVPF